jgi:hypothetical protein
MKIRSCFIFLIAYIDNFIRLFNYMKIEMLETSIFRIPYPVRSKFVTLPSHLSLFSKKHIIFRLHLTSLTYYKLSISSSSNLHHLYFFIKSPFQNTDLPYMSDAYNICKLKLKNILLLDFHRLSHSMHATKIYLIVSTLWLKNNNRLNFYSRYSHFCR